MRCPQCGYISFDQTASCGKCSGSLIKANRLLNGTGLAISSPVFLSEPATTKPAPSSSGDETIPETTEAGENGTNQSPAPDAAKAPDNEPSAPAINLDFDPDLGSQPSEEELMVNLEDIELGDLLLEQKAKATEKK